MEIPSVSSQPGGLDASPFLRFYTVTESYYLTNGKQMPFVTCLFTLYFLSPSSLIIINLNLLSLVPFRQRWAPCFAARRCAWCSSSFSPAQPTIVSVSWGSWAWWSSETWVTPDLALCYIVLKSSESTSQTQAVDRVQPCFSSLFCWLVIEYKLIVRYFDIQLISLSNFKEEKVSAFWFQHVHVFSGFVTHLWQ